jgi:hypothetical protein
MKYTRPHVPPLVNTLKHLVDLRNSKKIQLLLPQRNALSLHYKNYFVTVVGDITAVYSEINMKAHSVGIMQSFLI